jgi:precorrin-6B methylase 2
MVEKTMAHRTRGIAVTLATLLLFLGTPVIASAQEYQPSVGQEGKDVVWVPTPEELIKAMLDMARLTPQDYVIDLGSGDGRIVIAAAKRGAQALGVEYNPNMVELSKANAAKEGLAGKAEFVRGDIFETDFSKATIITMYLLPELNLRLRPKILELKPGTRIVSHAFSMDDWEADQTEEMEGRTAYLWIVPAKVAGTWTFSTAAGPAELTLKQTYQKLEGSLKVEGKQTPLQSAKLDGDRLVIAVAEGNPAVREYSGRVNGTTIEGVSRSASGTETKWVARRLTQR